MTIDLFKEAMAAEPGPYLIEGFPRTLESLTTFEEQCGSCAALLHLDVSEEAMQVRRPACLGTRGWAVGGACWGRGLACGWGVRGAEGGGDVERGGEGHFASAPFFGRAQER